MGVFHVMAPMARAIAELVENSETGNDLMRKR